MGLKAALGKEGREEEALAKKGKDTTMSKLGQLKDTAAGAVQKAVEYLSGKKEETKQKVVETAGKTKYMTYETAEKTKEKLSETEEKARRKMEELSKDEDANRAREASEQVTTGRRTIPIVERVKVDVVGTDQDPLLDPDPMGTRPSDVSCLDEEGKARVEVRIDDEGKAKCAWSTLLNLDLGLPPLVRLSLRDPVFLLLSDFPAKCLLQTLSEGKTPIYSTPTTTFLQIVIRSVMGMMGANHWWVGLDMNPVDFEKNNELLR
ncbi:hypothetical protein ACFX1S_014727 [Malus domestica]